MGGDKGKLAGGAAVGAGGILVAVLKSGSAEMHAVEATTRAAARAGEVGVVAHGASELGVAARGAGELGAGTLAGRGAGTALRTGENGAQRLVLAGAAGEVELRALQPFALAHVADEGTTVAAKGLAPVAAKGSSKSATTAASRAAKVKDAVEHALDAKDLLDHLSDVWDLSQKLDGDEDDAVDRKFASLGVDFRGDVVPAVTGAALPGITGAKRVLLSDGHKLVPAARLPAGLSTRPLDEKEKDDLAFGARYGNPGTAIYIEHPTPQTISRASSLPSMLLLAKLSPEIAWEEMETVGKTALPPVLEHGSRRFVRLAAGSAADAGADFVILLRVTTTSTTSDP